LVAAIAVAGDRTVTDDDARAFLEDPASVGIVGTVDGAPVGYLVAYLVRRIDGRSMLIVYDVGVAAAARRRGVGRAMIDAALDFARLSRCSKAWVITDHGNEAAMALYRETGAGHSGDDDAVMSWTL
jgi:ribosomal protein S18 acetylase RimI-like enzyme